MSRAIVVVLKLLLTGLLVIMFGGCVVKSTQLSAMIALIESPEINLSDNRWLLRYDANGNTSSKFLYSITVPEGTVFANKSGDLILFDGWLISVVKSMKPHQINVKISESAGNRMFEEYKRYSTVHSCKQWKLHRRTGVARFTQECKGKDVYTNLILVDSEGMISLVRQVYDDLGSTITLSKLN
jgi:hypothetical protein